MTITLQQAVPEQVHRCYEILDAGRAFQNANGFYQWDETYPTLEIVREDIQQETGWLILADGEIAGYFCLSFDGEPVYRGIRGAWNTSEDYAVIHRMAFDPKFRGAGLTRQVFPLIESVCLQRGIHAIRVDTDPCNQRMQHVFLQCGFTQCGTVEYPSYSPKTAFDKSF